MRLATNTQVMAMPAMGKMLVVVAEALMKFQEGL
jgi:hypothetical protein